MISSSHFLSVYIGVELLSLSLYAMVALKPELDDSHRSCDEVLCSRSPGIWFVAVWHVNDLRRRARLKFPAVAESLFSGKANKTILVFGVVFLVSGIAFKLGVVPFHMWIPDVYHGAPTAVAIFIGSAPKLAAFAIVIRMLVSGLIVVSKDWQTMLLILFSALDGHREFWRHRSNESETDVGVFRNIPHGLHVARTGDGRC